MDRPWTVLVKNDISEFRKNRVLIKSLQRPNRLFTSSDHLPSPTKQHFVFAHENKLQSKII